MNIHRFTQISRFTLTRWQAAQQITNVDATLLRALNPTLTPTQPQVDSNTPPDAQLGAPSQLPHFSPTTTTLERNRYKCFPLLLQRRRRSLLSSVDSQDNQGFIVCGDGSETNAGASSKSAGEGGERIGQQWSGTLAWRGTILRTPALSGRMQVTATASKGDPHGIEDLYSRAFLDWRQHGPGFVSCTCWIRSVNRRVTRSVQEEQPRGNAHRAHFWDGFAQLWAASQVAQVKELCRSLVSLPSRPLTSLTVCHWGLVYYEPSHRAVHAQPPWCSIPNHWDT